MKGGPVLNKQNRLCIFLLKKSLFLFHSLFYIKGHLKLQLKNNDKQKYLLLFSLFPFFNRQHSLSFLLLKSKDNILCFLQEDENDFTESDTGAQSEIGLCEKY